MAAWGVLIDSAGYILFGFFIAGLLKAYLPTEFIAKHLGGEAITKAGKAKRSIVAPVFKAALFGVPLPLCSCGVIPAAAGLREQGASKGATTAFLIATPETGVDSMTVTYGLLDPIMTIVRPVSAFITSVAAGIAVDIFDKDDHQKTDVAVAQSMPATSSCCCSEPKPEPKTELKPISTCCCSDSKPESKPEIKPVHVCRCSEEKAKAKAEGKPEPVSSCSCSTEAPKVVVPVSTCGCTPKPEIKAELKPISSCCCSEPKPEPKPELKPISSCCCSEPKPEVKPEIKPISSCCCSEPKPELKPMAPASSCCSSTIEAAPKATSSCCSSQKPAPSATLFDKFKVGMSFAFGKLIADIGIWLLFGIVLAALISVFIPADMFTDKVTGFAGMLVMMAIGIPMYVCATASTPIAAAFALKGISPGAALVFLLAGPATNVATITVVARMLGKRAAFIYVTTIGIVTLAIGVLVNYLYMSLGLSVTSWATGSSCEHHGPLAVPAAFVLVALILVQWTKKWCAKKTAVSSCCSGK